MQKIKEYLSSLIAGFLVLVLTTLFIKFVSLNMIFVTIFVVILLYISGYILRANRLPNWIKSLLICMPIIAGFYLLILNELPRFWIVFPLYLGASFTGGIKNDKTKLIGSVALLFATLCVAFVLIPNIISNDLVKVVNADAPVYYMLDLDSNDEVTNSTFEGKVLVLDFFGTWCRPCIAEMAELEKVKQHFSDREDIEFAIACTDTGMDTPEKALDFKERRNLSFDLLYDYNSESHRKFKFSGVPALVIIDKSGNVRLTHEGYNEAENLKETLISTIERLVNEK